MRAMRWRTPGCRRCWPCCAPSCSGCSPSSHPPSTTPLSHPSLKRRAALFQGLSDTMCSSSFHLSKVWMRARSILWAGEMSVWGFWADRLNTPMSSHALSKRHPTPHLVDAQSSYLRMSLCQGVHCVNSLLVGMCSIRSMAEHMYGRWFLIDKKSSGGLIYSPLIWSFYPPCHSGRAWITIKASSLHP